MKNNEKLLAARPIIGQFFKERREQMGHSLEVVAVHLGISPNTLERIANNKFSWDIDMHLKYGIF